MVTSAVTGVDSSAWDFVRHYTHVGFTFTRNAVFVNRRALEALSPADQAAVRTAAATAETRGWRMSEEAHTTAMETLRSRGVTVTQGNPAVMQAMSRISEQMVNEWLTRAGEDGQRLIQAIRTARG
jgi:TRAP-type C4-dicarboxylate transport system substrate-binding protein